MSSEAEALAEFLVVLFPFMTMGMFVLIFAFSFLLFIALYIVFSIPYYKMAKKAGLPNPWLVFVPLGCYYIYLHLARREFNLFDWIKTNDRTKVFWWYLIGYGGYIAISMILSIFCMIPFIQIIFYMIFSLVSMAFYVALYIFMWRINYDILMTYGMQEHAMWASIVSCFVPIVMVVFSFMIMNNEPDYTV